MVDRYAFVCFLLLSAIFTIAYLSVTKSVGPVAGFLSFYAGTLLGGFAGLIAHEGGHVLCAVATSIPVRLMCIGAGRLLLRFQLGETTFELRENPLRVGFVASYPALHARKFRMLFFIAGGVLGNMALLALVIWWCEAFRFVFPFGVVLSGAALAQVTMIVGNLFPRDVHVNGNTLRTDGRQLWQTLWSPRSGPTEAARFWASRLQTYGGGLDSSTSPAAPRICFQLSRDRWADAELRKEVDAALVRELRRGGLRREEELIVLDALLTDALLFGDPDLRVQLDEWSLRAVTLAPAIKTLHGTRGSVLVELGHYAEAIPLLEPLTEAEEKPLDVILSHAFLARAKGGLGDLAAAKRHAAEARRICNGGQISNAITSLVERIAVEVGLGDQQEVQPVPS
jgi:hypothetical protein